MSTGHLPVGVMCPDGDRWSDDEGGRCIKPMAVVATRFWPLTDAPPIPPYVDAIFHVRKMLTMNILAKDFEKDGHHLSNDWVESPIGSAKALSTASKKSFVALSSQIWID